MDDVRRVGRQSSPFTKRVTDEGNVPLGQVTYSSVNKFGRSAGRSFSEVTLLKENDLITTARGIQSDARSGYPSTNDRDIPIIGLLLGDLNHRIALHGYPFLDP
jgi:hypothetical protein